VTGADGLVHVVDSMPGIRRHRRGRGFSYVGPDGRRITDSHELERIRALAIPPAYDDVWICADPRGHIQATGRDARGRKQYRYHPRWRARRDADKFGRMIAFGERLPSLRRIQRRDLALDSLPEAKVLAVVTSLLATTCVRVGNEEYARSNGSYGLTTLRARHLVFLRAGRAKLRFRGKGGRPHEVDVDNARLVRLLRRCQRLPGQMLFQYLDDDGHRQPIDSDKVNAYLHAAMGEAFTAKDFRTWSATTLAVAALAGAGPPDDADADDGASRIARIVEDVARELRNTPAVCRNSYIHPGVFDAWRTGRLQEIAAPDTGRFPRKLEIATLRILRATSRGRRRRGRCEARGSAISRSTRFPRDRATRPGTAGPRAARTPRPGPGARRWSR
jgi:DNA topoisomerase IB